MRLRDWFILIGTCFGLFLLWAVWSQHCYQRGYDAGYEAAAAGFDA